MLPPCRDLPNAVWLNHDVPRAALEQRLIAEGTDAGGWIVLARCRDCGQQWRVDQPDKYQVDLAIKVPASRAWSAAEDRGVRLDYLIRSHGGESTDPCIWAGCPHHALRGVAMCAEHAYTRMGARARGA